MQFSPAENPEGPSSQINIGIAGIGFRGRILYLARQHLRGTLHSR
jgi:hypothetical protein